MRAEDRTSPRSGYESWKKPIDGSSGVPINSARSRRVLFNSQLVSGNRTHAWQAARLTLSAPLASDSTQSGSAEHHLARLNADGRDVSSLFGSPCATKPPRLPAESLVAV